MAMRFKNSANGYVEDVSHARALCFSTGCFYFAAKGVWTHAVVAGALAILTFGLSWFIYPFFANQIMRTHYLRLGWIDVSAEPPTSVASSLPPPPSPVSPTAKKIGIACFAFGIWFVLLQDHPRAVLVFTFVALSVLCVLWPFRDKIAEAIKDMLPSA